VRKLRTGGQFLPFSTTGTVLFPGFDGGAEWGGAAVDPEGILYVNANEMPWVAAMADAAERPQMDASASLGELTYAVHCAACHGADRRGGGQQAYPSLVALGERLSQEQVREVINQGRGFMPAFRRLSDAEKDALVAFLFGLPEDYEEEAFKEALNQAAESEIPYTFQGYHRFVDAQGYPAVKPPWGTLNAIDLNTGEYRWKTPLGEVPELTARGIPPTGTENYGGPVVTAGGLLFIAATKDEMFRAFDKDTGALLWETKLPAGGYATPSTYMAGGKQYVVIAAGGGKMGTPPGDAYVAFALPD
jgi:quinoprotein glucose dehydrogenase